METMKRVKKIKKITSAFMMLLLLGTFLAGCGGQTSVPGGTEEVEDSSKTQLLVATFDGGIGADWIIEAGERFEEAFADTSFEEGKKGVQVKVLKSTNYGGETILDTLQAEEADVWFTETVNYRDHINAENFADITDIVTEKLDKYGENKSIADKMDENFRNFLNVGTEDGAKYYAIPFYDGFYGLIYDKDLFAEANLYFASSGTAESDADDALGFVSSEADKKSAGADGKYDTYDDGLPATHAQFLLLIEKMKESDITPFVYGGSNAMSYPLRAMASFWAQAEGAEGYRLNYTLSGTTDNLVQMDASGAVVKAADGSVQLESTQITVDNGYDLQRQVSKYYVLDLFHNILVDKDNYSDSSLVHTAAQSDFLKGKEDQYTTYGMLLDGTWWENEAKESFDALATRYGDAHKREERNLGFMPLPVADASQVGRENVLLNANTSLAFIRSTTDIMDCAKAFLQFTTTDKELSAFTASVSMTRSLDYELTEEHAEKTSSYGKDLYALRAASTVIYPYSSEEVYQNNQAFFSTERWSWNSLLDNAEYVNPWQLWLNYADKYPTDVYFEGMYQNQKTKWGTLMR